MKKNFALFFAIMAICFGLYAQNCNAPNNVQAVGTGYQTMHITWDYPSQQNRILLYHNVNFVNLPGDGFNDADVSKLYGGQSSFGMNATYPDYGIADDITLEANAFISKLTFYAFVENASINDSPITGVQIKIYDSRPTDNTSAPVWSSTLAAPASCTWTGAYRTQDAIYGNTMYYQDTTRPIFAIEANVNASLTAGNYWISVAFNTADNATVWGIPLVDNNHVSTGNAYVYDAALQAWTPWQDASSHEQMGMPFSVYGYLSNDNLMGFNVFRDGVQVNTQLVETPYYDDNDLSMTALTEYCYTVKAVYTNCTSAHSDSACGMTSADPCFISTVPYTEDFNDYAVGNDIFPNCWQTISSYSPAQPYINRITALATPSLLIPASNANNTIAIAPSINPYEFILEDLVFSVKAHKTNANAALAVGVMSDPTDYQSFQPIDTVTPSATNTFEEFYFDFTSATYQGNYIAFKAINNSISIDDFTVYPIQCMHPASIYINEVGADYVTFAWHSFPGTEPFIIHYKESDEFNWISDEYIYDTVYTIYGLDVLESYSFDVMVKSSCGDDNNSITKTLTFSTTCDKMNVPFMENFDQFYIAPNVGFAVPDCWEKVNSGGTNYGFPYVEKTSNNAFSKPRNLKFESKAIGVNGQGDNYAVLPELDMPINMLDLRFWGFKSVSSSAPQNNGTMIVGVVTNTSDNNSIMSSFIPIDTLTIHQGGDFYRMSFENYYGNGRITLKSPKVNDITNTFIIDNVEIFQHNIFDHPDYMSCVGGTSSSLKVSWIPSDGNPTSYNLAYKPADGFGWTEINNITDTVFNITGLADDTKYDIKVMSNYAGGSSTYSFPFTFKTECFSTISIPYSNNFDNDPTGTPECWSSATNGGSVGVKASSYAYTSPNILSISGKKAWISTPAINEPIETLSMSFYVRRSGNDASGPLMIGVSSEPKDESNFELVGTAYPSSTGIYERFEFNFGSVTNIGTGKHIVFRVNTTSSIEYMIEDMDIYFSTPCSTPTNLSVSNVTSNSATLNWTSDSATTSCNIMYKTLYEEDWHFINGINGNSYTLNNLPVHTSYQVRIQSTCGSDDSRWSDMVNFTTTCGYVEYLPYKENFNSYTTSEQPACWSQGYSGTHSSVSSYPKISTTQSYSGTKSYYFMSFSTSYSYAVLPELGPNISLNTLQLNYKLFSNNPAKFIVGTMSDPDDPDSFMPWDTVSIGSTGEPEWKEFTTSFANCPNGDSYIAVRPGTGNYFIFMDDVSLEYIPTCFKPTLVTVERIGDTWVDLSWHKGASEQQWKVAYKPSTEVSWNYITVNDTNVRLTNLNNITTYLFKVCSVCGATSESEYSETKSFTTYCESIYSLPYVENFDTYGTVDDAFPTCWIRNWEGHDVIKPKITTSHYSGIGGLIMEAENIFTTMVAAPELDTSINMHDLRVSFKARRNTNINQTIIFGITDNPHDIHAFVPLDTIAPVYGMNDWDHVNLYLSDYNLPNGRYIALYKPFNGLSSGFSTFTIDDFVINSTDCSAPQDLAITNVGSTWANIEWSHSPMIHQWEYVYGPSGFHLEDSIPSLIEADSVTINGLQIDTRYDFYVRNICPTGDYSDWSQRYVFSTSCSPIATIPYYEDFDNFGTSPEITHYTFPFCWAKTGNGTSQLSSLSYQYYFSGPAALVIRRDNSQYEYVCTPEINDNLSYLQISFLGKFQNSYESIDIGVMDNPMDTSTFTLVETLNARSSAWNEFLVPLTSYTGTGHYIAFRAQGGSAVTFYIDNFRIDNAPVCVKPVNPSISNIQLNTVDVNWTPGRLEENWQVAYGIQGFNPETSSTSTIINTNTHPTTLTGLTEGTFYDVYVRSVCSDSTYSDWSSVTSFRTRCLAIDSVPYTESFDTYGIYSNYGYNYSDIFPTCWDRNTNSSKNNEMVYWFPSLIATHQDGIASLEFKSTENTYCIGSMAPLGNLSIDTLQIHFFMRRNSTNGMLQVGVMSNPFDIATFQLVQTVRPVSTNNWEEFTIPFDTYTGTGRYIAFKCEGNNNFYIDKISLVRIPTCIEPSNFQITNITENSITLDWIDTINENNSWEIYYGSLGFSLDAPEYTDFTSTVPYTITGLQEGVDYEFYLRAYCAANDQSFWIEPISGRTLCSAPKQLPYTETFDNYDGTNLYDNTGLVPGCWFAYRDNTTIPVPHIVKQNANYSFPNSLMMVSRNGSANSYAVLPLMADSLNRLSVMFWKRMYDSQGSSRLSIGYMTDNMDFNTFVEIDTIAHEYDMGGSFDTIQFITYPNIPAQGYIAFKFSSNYMGNDYCAIDNLVVNNNDFVECLPPTNLTVSNIGLYSATFSWTPGGEETSWIIETRELDDEEGFYSGVQSFNPSISITGFRENTEYIARVSAVCYYLWESGYSDTVHFKTLGDEDAIEDYTLAKSISLYPNPTTGQFTIHNTQCMIQNVSVYDVFGKLLKTIEINDAEAKLDISEFANGMYFARINSEKGVVTKRLIKK